MRWSFDELVIRHVRLSEEHGHVAWHATRNRVNTKVHFTTIGFQQFGELLDHMLRLSNRHSVTGDDRHVGRGFQNIVGVRCIQPLAYI